MSAENAVSLALLSQLFESDLLLTEEKGLNLDLASNRLPNQQKGEAWQNIYGWMTDVAPLPRIDITMNTLDKQDFIAQITSEAHNVKVLKHGSGPESFVPIVEDAAACFGRKIRSQLGKTNGETDPLIARGYFQYDIQKVNSDTLPM